MTDLGTTLSSLLDLVRLEPVIVLEEAVYFGVVSIGFLGAVSGYRILKEFTAIGSGVSVILLTGCVLVGMVVIGQDWMERIFIWGYVFVAIFFRAAQGFALGVSVRPAYILLAFMLVIAAAVFWEDLSQIRLPHPLPPDAFPRSVITIAVAGFGSFFAARALAEYSEFDTPLAMIGTFALFLSVQLYLPHNALAVALYRWSFPSMLIVGICVRSAILRNTK